MMTQDLQIVTNLINSGLERGWSVTVRNGIHGDGEIVLRRSTDLKAILNELDTTEGDALYFMGGAGECFGTVYLLWGNDDGECIYDHSTSLLIDEPGHMQPDTVAA